MLRISQKIKDKLRGKITKKRNKQQQQQSKGQKHRHSFSSSSSSSSSSGGGGDIINMTTAATDTRRRVKLYALNAERQWDDRGTGHVSSNYVERLKGTALLVRAESDGSSLLESKIQPDTAYQKQQDTLIVWSEGDNFDLALSFQEKVGCDEIWEKICQVQGKDPSVEITQDIVEESEDERFEDMSDTAPPIELPPCELARLEDISETIQNSLTTQVRKEKLALALESENYIKKLLGLFRVCEDLDNTEGLHYLFEIFKNIFLLNKNALFEIMFAEDTIFDVVGCLEFDPNLSQPKKHRQYLRQLAKFREAVPIRNQDLLAKIHQTYRVQYIQDIILPTPSVFVEDNMLNTLSSFIFFNKVEIVTLIQEDEKYLTELFSLLTDPTTEDTKRRDTVLFLKEFCNYAQNLQPQGKDAFYKTLTSLGILQALEITLVMNDQKTKSASIDILTAIVEYSPSIVRNYSLQQMNKTDAEQILINIAIEQMLSDSEPELGGAVQLVGVIRILLDPENMLTEKADFLNIFYKYSIQTLIAPLLLNTVGDKPQNEDYQTAQLLALVLEILAFCVEHHSYHIKSYIIQKDLLKRILVLMKSNHTFLVLCALRLLRRIIQIKDEFYNRHIVKGNLFAPVVDAFIRNRGRYNLLESAILELFEFIKLEDIKTLCVYFVENFSKVFDPIEYVQTFKYLKTKYDQYQDRIKERDKISDSMQIIRNSRYRRDQRQLEEEEESWFNEEEDFTEELDSYSVMKSKTVEKNGKLSNSLNTSSLSPTSTTQSSPPHQTTATSTNSGTGSSSSSPLESFQQHPLHNFQQIHQQQLQKEEAEKMCESGVEDLKETIISTTAESSSSSSSSSSSNDSLNCENSQSSPPRPVHILSESDRLTSEISLSDVADDDTITDALPLDENVEMEDEAKDEDVNTVSSPSLVDKTIVNDHQDKDPKNDNSCTVNELKQIDETKKIATEIVSAEKDSELMDTTSVNDTSNTDSSSSSCPANDDQKSPKQISLKECTMDEQLEKDENVSATTIPDIAVSESEDDKENLPKPKDDDKKIIVSSCMSDGFVDKKEENNSNKDTVIDIAIAVENDGATNSLVISNTVTEEDTISAKSVAIESSNPVVDKAVVIKGLVDYEGDSDEEEEEDDSPEKKKARLA